MVAAQPLWAKLFYLVRTGHMREALDEALAHRQAIEHREDSFVAHFRLWLESPDHRSVARPVLPPRRHVLTASFSFSLPKPHRDHVQAIYNAHILHSTSVDPFKLALYKLMGKLDHLNAMFHLSLQRRRIGSGFNSQWYAFLHRVHLSPLLSTRPISRRILRLSCRSARGSW